MPDFFFASQLDLPSWRYVGGLQQFCFLFFILASSLLFSFLKSGSHIAHEVEEKAKRPVQICNRQRGSDAVGEVKCAARCIVPAEAEVN